MFVSRHSSKLEVEFFPSGETNVGHMALDHVERWNDTMQETKTGRTGRQLQFDQPKWSLTELIEIQRRSTRSRPDFPELVLRRFQAFPFQSFCVFKAFKLYFSDFYLGVLMY